MHVLTSSGVYQILNTVNGNYYIGSAVQFNRRWNLHRVHLRKGKHHSTHLQRAWDKYGEETFEFKPLLVCTPTKDLMYLYEQRCIDVFRPEYNMNQIAGSRLGMKNSPEATAKTAAALRGGKHTPEHCYKTGAAWRGKTFPPETRTKISIALKGKRKPPRTKEHAAKIGAANRGKKKPPWTREHRANLSLARTGMKFTPEHCANIRAARLNFLRSHTNE